jgi:phosphate:Na+ symporter
VVAGDRLRNILDKLTANRFTGLLTGAGITAVVQSSSVTTVLVVGFISAGLMTFVQSIPVILGSNIGTTITAQIIAFNVTRWALVLVGVGFVVSVATKRARHRAWGSAIMGLGLVFFGMVVMGEAMEPLRTYDVFIDLMAALENPFLGIFVGAIFTALVQSSSATTGVVIVLAGQGLITLDAGIALILGANVGTSVTALLAAIGKPRDAQRAAVAHLLFNVVGVLIWLPFIDVLASLVEQVGGGTPREIANAHTVFNVANALIFLPFVSQFAALVIRLVPDKPDKGAMQAKYIDDGLVSTPELALSKARMEMLRMASRVRGMLGDVLPATLDGDLDDLDEVESMDDEVDALHGLILQYLGRISQSRLSESSSDEMMDLMEATNALEAIGDIIETNVVTLGRQRLEAGIEVSDATREVIGTLHKSVYDAFDLALVAVTQKDQAAARQVASMKSTIRDLERDAVLHQAERLVADEPSRVENYRLEIDLIANLKRIYYFTRRIARVAVPEEEQATL